MKKRYQHTLMRYAFATLAFIAFVLPCMGESIVFPAGSGVINVTQEYPNVTSANATTATTAMKQAFADAAAATDSWANRVTLYFEDGTYTFNDAIVFDTGTSGNGNLKGIIIQGQSMSNTIFRLADSTLTSTAKAFISTSSCDWNNVAFMMGVYNLTINTGSGNTKAAGLDFIANNSGSVRNVLIKSEDGQGYAGLDMSLNSIPGPALIKNVVIDGYDVGIRIDGMSYSMTFENITLRNQRKVGISNDQNILNMRKITCENQQGLAVYNGHRYGFITLIDSTLSGTGENAISNAAGFLFLRNVTTSGYTRALHMQGTNIAGTTIGEYVGGEKLYQHVSGGSSLNIPVVDTPEEDWEETNDWVSVMDFLPSNATNNQGNNEQSGIQDAIDSMAPSGANYGKTTLYFPIGEYHVNGGIAVNGYVKRIIGLFSSIVTKPEYCHDSHIFEVEDGGPYATLYIERFLDGSQPTSMRSTPFVLNQASRDVVIRDIFAIHGKFYKNNGASGRLFIENVAACSSRYSGGGIGYDPIAEGYPGVLPQFDFGGQTVFARQLNSEQFRLKVYNNGGSLWILGIKTEEPGTVVLTTGGGKTEVLGGFVLPSDYDAILETDAAFIISNADATILCAEHAGWNAGPKGTNAIVISDTKGSTNLQIGHDDVPHRCDPSGFEAGTESFVVPFYVNNDNRAEPVASNVAIAGTLAAGETLTGTYDYYDVNGDTEDTSGSGTAYRWLTSSTSNGTYTAIAGATSTTYTVAVADIGAYVKFEVTPKATAFPETGTAAPSIAFGPVLDPGMPNVLVSPAGNIMTNASFTIALTVTTNFGYWKTNGMAGYEQFSTNGTNLTITASTTLYYYGSNANVSTALASNVYEFDTTAPTVTVTPGSTNYHAPFTLSLSVDEETGYWSMTGTNAFHSFTSSTNISVSNRDVVLYYYGQDGYGNTSSLMTNTYIFEDEAPAISTLYYDRAVVDENAIGFIVTIADADGDAMSLTLAYSNASYGMWTNIPRSDILSVVGGVYTQATTTGLANGAYSLYWRVPTELRNNQDAVNLRFTVASLDESTQTNYNDADISRLYKTESTLSNATVLNNPYTGQGESVTFVGLTANTTQVDVYTLTGDRVISIPVTGGEGRVEWFLKNEASERVAPGMYYCILRTSLGDTKIVRVMLTRMGAE